MRDPNAKTIMNTQLTEELRARRVGRRFPILGVSQKDIDEHPERPRNVPWSMLSPFEANAKRNHDQSLELLAARGGLSPTEMIAVIEGRPIRWVMQQPRDEVACWNQLIELIRQHEGIAATEIEFLRWFYVHAPLSGMPETTMREAKEAFESESRKVLPKGYEIKK